MIALVLALTASLQDPQQDNLLGWTMEPPAAVEGLETELDRLSRSPSGSGFLADLFGGQSGDDRIPLTVTLRALDKVTARFTDLVLPIGEPQAFGSLTLLPRTCSTRPPEEFPETTVFLEIYSGEGDEAGQRLRDEKAEVEELPPVDSIGETIMASIDESLFGEAVFKGWMFASTPSLNALEHPTYDVWVINCTMEDPAI